MLSYIVISMVTLSWKTKRKLQTAATSVFSGEQENEEIPEYVDWLTATKKRKHVVLEDASVKCNRLEQEGVLLAENERYWEAIKCWDEALRLNPISAKLHEMKAQVLLELGELFPAVCCAEKAVELDPVWSIGKQTLGRAQLGLGEVEMAQINFQKALHLDPQNTEVHEDLSWAVQLLKQKNEQRSNEQK